MFGLKRRSASPPKLSSAESLDVMMTITSPTGWLLLAACAAIILAVIVWSIVHRIPERVDGKGQLVPGRTQAVEAPITGIVTKIFVRPGQEVKAGEKVIALTVPNAVENLDILRRELATLEANQTSEEIEVKEADVKKRKAYEESRQSYLDQLERARVARTRAEQRLAKQKAGGFSPAERQTVETEIKNQATQVATLAQNMESLEKGRLDELYGVNNTKRAAQETMRLKREEIFQEELKVERVLGAIEDGRVFNVMVDEGNMVNADQLLVRLEQPNRELEAIIYVPSRPGQKVKVGHAAEVSPSTVSADAFGSINGRVTVKADYPSTRAGIVNDLRNETLADEYIKGGAPLRMEVALTLDEGDPSGYSWTGGIGPGTKLIPGTPCQVTLIVDQKRPIDYVIPLFKKH